jgi:hypothetical protein
MGEALSDGKIHRISVKPGLAEGLELPFLGWKKAMYLAGRSIPVLSSRPK